jgi:hypothetical protein
MGTALASLGKFGFAGVVGGTNKFVGVAVPLPADGAVELLDVPQAGKMKISPIPTHVISRFNFNNLRNH